MVSMKVYIKGVGMTKFGVDRKSSHERICEVIGECLKSTDMNFDDIDVIFASNSESERNEERQKHQGPMLSTLFQREMPILNVPAGCAGGGVALWNSINYLRSSDCKNIMVIGYDNIVSLTSEIITDEILMGSERICEQTEGLNFPAQNALVAQQYMMKYGATSDDLALIALKNHENAFDNPKAMFYKKKVTLDMIKKSPVVASPLRLFDCSISVNGAAAAIISKDPGNIEIIGSGMCTTSLSPIERKDMTSMSSTIKAAKTAYEQAGIKPEDLDIAELHDAFTPLELLSYEDLGFAKKGHGAELIRDGTTKINGSLPVNTSGGLKAKGHPISPTGLAQIYEISKQMKNECGKRQINKPKYGLAQNVGGVGTMAAVHILKNLN
jgi:acetyl-CoA C-acetyltransferase|tara:strand:+ start:3760 stop:4908 length:1149 start_codon:yes stop_codon:yes gene_type:complete